MSVLAGVLKTELFKLTGGNVKAVCSWIGNSPEVAMQHYAQVTEADMEQAAKLTVLNDAVSRVHNRVHTTGVKPEMSRQEPQEKLDDSIVTPSICEASQQKTKACESLRNTGSTSSVGRAGFEPAKTHANGFTAHPL